MNFRIPYGYGVVAHYWLFQRLQLVQKAINMFCWYSCRLHAFEIVSFSHCHVRSMSMTFIIITKAISHTTRSKLSRKLPEIYRATKLCQGLQNHQGVLAPCAGYAVRCICTLKSALHVSRYSIRQDYNLRFRFSKRNHHLYASHKEAKKENKVCE